MQRVSRDTTPDLPIAEHQPAIDLLHRLLPPHESRLFALPRAGADGLREWWTSLEGQPQPYSSLDEKSQAALLEKYQGTLNDLHTLGDTVRQQGRTDEAGLLAHLPRTPDTRFLYSLNGTPLITHWHAGLSGMPPPVVPPAVPAAAAPPIPPARRGWPWLLALLALLALLLAAWWWWTHRTLPVAEPLAPPAAAPVEPPPPEPAVPPAPEPVAPVVPEPVVPEPVVPEPVVPEPVAPEPVAPEPPPPPAPKPAPPKPARPAPAGLVCAPRPADQLPPELVVVFDTSDSMNLNIATRPADEDWIFNLTNAQRSRLSTSEKARFLAMLQKPTREEVAKKSLINLVGQLPKSQSISLVTFNSCKATPRHGPFPGSQHAKLIQLIQGLKSEGGTPLARSIEAAAAMVDGKNRDAIIVVFLDGEDGCDGNQCAAAARIAKAKPRLKFNVVDISGRGLSDCIAKSTGGRVYSTQNTARIAEALKQSVWEVSEGVTCK